MPPFIKILDIFSSWPSCTLEEDDAIVLALDLSFIENLPEGDKMELDSELTRDMFKYASLFSHVVVGRGGVLAPSNFFKKKGIWK